MGKKQIKSGFIPLEVKNLSQRHREASRKLLTGFTLIELLTAVAIISILIAVLIPSLSMVRDMARQTKQNAQFSAIDLALLSFKADYGDYPPSLWHPALSPKYCGAQKLAEALLGLDLLGFNPNTVWDPTQPVREQYYPANLDPTDPCDRANLDARKGPYLEPSRANAFRLGISAAGASDGLFANTMELEKDTYVICDIYGTKTIVYSNGRTVKAGTPILYYKADPSKKTISTGLPQDRIYNCLDNYPLIDLRKMPDGKPQPLGDNSGMFQFFYQQYIKDPRITNTAWPYRPDSYVLISAGADGFYGTSDDVTNF